MEKGEKDIGMYSNLGMPECMLETLITSYVHCKNGFFRPYTTWKALPDISPHVAIHLQNTTPTEMLWDRPTGYAGLPWAGGFFRTEPSTGHAVTPLFWKCLWWWIPPARTNALFMCFLNPPIPSNSYVPPSMSQ